MLPQLKKILKQSNVPQAVITELAEKPIDYQTDFLNAIETIIQDEILSLHAFLETRGKLKDFYGW